jgi:TolB protein
MVLSVVLVVLVVVVMAVAIFSMSLRSGPLTLQNRAIGAQEGGDAQAAGIPFAPPPAALAFSGNAAGSWDIYILEPSGELRNLTNDDVQYHDYFPSFSLDGERINFISNRGEDVMGPSQVNPDGTGLRSLTILGAVLTLFGEGRLDWDPAWSPGGDRLLWSSLRDLNLELYAIPTTAEFVVTNATRLTSTSSREWFGAWSPDGQSVLYQSDRDGKENLFIMAADGSANRALTASQWDEIHGMWSLDGQQVLYLYNEADARLPAGDLNLHIISADGTDARPFDGIFVGDAVYAPGGEQLAYVSNESGRWQIYVMNADGTNRRRVTPDNGDYLFPVWVP